MSQNHNISGLGLGGRHYEEVMRRLGSRKVLGMRAASICRLLFASSMLDVRVNVAFASDLKIGRMISTSTKCPVAKC
jgi:hypothetical protein